MAQPQDLPLPLSLKLFLPCQVWNFSPLLLFTFFSPCFFLKSFCLPSPLQRPLLITRGSPPLTAMYVGDDGEVEIFFFFFCYINIYIFWKSDVREGDLRPTLASPTPCTDREGSWVEANVRPPQLPIHIDWRPCQLTGFQQFRLSFKWIVDHFIRDDSLMNWTKLGKVWSTEFKRNSLDFGMFVDTHILQPAESDLQNCDFSSP